MSSDNRETLDVQEIDRHVHALMEHFDTVQIFCTRSDRKDGGTVYVNRGAGNLFARTGQARAWCLVQDEEIRASVTRNVAL